MPPLKSYLIEAVCQWSEDSGFDPYIVVKVDENCRVPTEYVENGRIVLDICSEATSGLAFEEEAIVFKASFGTNIFDCYIPYENIIGVFPEGNPEEGVFFDIEKKQYIGKKETKNDKKTNNSSPISFSRVK